MGSIKASKSSDSDYGDDIYENQVLPSLCLSQGSLKLRA